ncbi:MAG: hypothetical protein GY856_23525, partial [bacterium]|nr:hypothetical protein [bacterium]
ALTPTGEFLVVWDGSLARRFDHLDRPLDEPVHLAAGIEGSAYWKAVSADRGGNFVVVWDSTYCSCCPGGCYDSGPYLSRFDGAAQDWLPPKAFSELDQPIVGHAGDGSFVVGGVEDVEDGVLALRFSADGEPLTSEPLVVAASGVTGDSDRVALAVQPQGDALMLWRTSLGIAGALVPASGAFTGESVRVSRTAGALHGQPDVTVMPGNRFLAVWYRLDEPGAGTHVVGRLLDAAGTPLGEEIPISRGAEGLRIRPRVAADGNGDALVVWERQPEGGSSEIRALLLDAAGLPLGGELVLGPVQHEGVPHRPVVTASPQRAGEFVVAWREESAVDPNAVFAQRLVRSAAAASTALRLANHRFDVRVEWRDFAGSEGWGRVVPIQADDSGIFWFFDPENWEMLVKVLDGCALNGHYWIFAAATTNVEYTLRVTDALTGRSKSYFNPLGNAAAAITDTLALASCEAPAGAVRGTVPADRSEIVVGELAPGSKEAPCVPGATELCLNHERFRVEVDWRDFAGRTGSGRVAPVAADDSGILWFFDADNWEMLVKVLDGCALNRRFWVFAAATTNVEYTLRVTDTVSGAVKTYFNPDHPDD